ncbi:MAG: aminopeptidase [Acidobacteria bacterium RIFCSPLOWO2_02_FULL_61_28]|nr:MAG: aminopeptidase [Acidobacteria bacterium RIFCSPLOWO2_02_FULL_61_28]
MGEVHLSETTGADAALDIGEMLHRLAVRLFPICRSLTGNGVRQTLNILREHIPLQIHDVPSGTQVLDWTVPKEWNIRDAFVEDEHGNRIIDFRSNNLHVVGYSVPVACWVSLSELQKHLYSLEDQPDAIPYITSYYQERWGFCIAHHERVRLREGQYRVFIDSDLKDGHLTYGECIVPGREDREVFLSTYICHPSMANNELSGPVILSFLAKWLLSQPRRYTYRIIFIPETIGAITYLSRHLFHLREKVVVGFNLSCLGDERAYSYVASRYGDTLADKIASNVLRWRAPDFKRYSFLERGSDERQYCSPGVDLPVVTLCRSKYGTYPEYHTSLDNLDLVTPAGLRGGYEMVRECISVIENNRTCRVTCYGEPQLGKRGLYPSLSGKTSSASVETMMNFLAYADGTNDLVDISNIIGKPVWEILPIAERLVKAGLLEEINEEKRKAIRSGGRTNNAKLP